METMRAALAALGAVMALWTGGAARAAEPLPAMTVVLTPVAAGGRIERLEVDMTVQAPRVAAGQPLLRMPTFVVGVPTAAYDARAISARDDQGELPLTIEDEPPTPTGHYRRWLPARATSGDVRLRYGTAPRVVDAKTRNGPLFDLRSEAGGVVGAGIYFLAPPAGEQRYRLSLRWNLDRVPTGWRGVSSFGEGPRTAEATSEMLGFSYFAAGPVRSEPAEVDTAFALYWLATPPFDTAGLARDIRQLYDHMARFFDDSGAPYRIFVRGNPYPAGGGTAGNRSFMFGYGVGGQTSSGDDLQMLLAHEITHNWPRMNVGEHGETAWYSEGTAEYYSVLLARRAGVIDLAKFQRVINEHAAGYYTNPFLALSNVEVGKRFWQDARAQRVPYGRGFMYLARVDALLRAKTAGRQSLDDLVRQVLRRQRAGEKVGNPEWVAMVTAILGDDARKDFDAMVAGERLEIPPNSFGPCFAPAAKREVPFDLGFDEMRLASVNGLRSDSGAARAGLADGDEIVRMTPIREVKNDPAKTISVTYRRGGEERTVSFLPRSAGVPSTEWRRVEGVADAECKL
ncbi:hypothetical protein [Mitsuaria sp. GD03876]|uniref:hypothetical protein n=1 Tax=Mitsuaria sp. GD03876 TaxID=2975399 RepID=UPI0024493EA5|nr:hypothetical protein [Mitsuaria sp. GD03876]MDH0867346.1 hypothetical protein [Mitsuaria sp. GD03876]